MKRRKHVYLYMGFATDAMLYCCQVTAGDGHSWKGSVVSDTVKRGCPSVPVVSVQRQDVQIRRSIGKVIFFLHGLLVCTTGVGCYKARLCLIRINN